MFKLTSKMLGTLEDKLSIYHNLFNHIECKAEWLEELIFSSIKPHIQNKDEIDWCTNEDNINGEKVKVVIISKAGSEGLDFKNIRQVHILEPWYNLNRIEQIIGRAVRFCSHIKLPFEKRNTEIYIYMA